MSTTLQMLDYIDEEADELTPWEATFVKDIRHQLENKGTISDRQLRALETIYTTRTC